MYEELEKRVEEALAESDFTFTVEDDGPNHYVLFRASSPAGEDVCLEETWSKADFPELTMADLVVFVENEANHYNADEHAELWIETRGSNGVPSTIRDLLDDAEAIGEMIEDLARMLRGALR